MRARALSTVMWLVALGCGFGWIVQRQAALVLREEVRSAQQDQAEIKRLQEENRRLAAVLPSAAEIAALQADHAAVLRLRAEIERLKDGVQARDRALVSGSK